MTETDPEKFFTYTRMTPELFDHLLNLVRPFLTKRKAVNSVGAEERLCITLHYLADGCSMIEKAFNFHLGKSTIHYILQETTEVLWEILAPTYLPKEDLVDISRGFYQIWNRPNCVGAIDGKHINIQSPKYSGSEYYNHHSNLSIVLMASCDAFYKFTYVDIGSPGSNHDSSIFKSSGFGEATLNDDLDFPDDAVLTKTEFPLPFFFVGDQAFPLHKRIMRP